jgi:hypothetical protein
MSPLLAALAAVALAQSNPPLPPRAPAAAPVPAAQGQLEPAPPEAPPVVEEPAAPEAPPAPAPAPGDPAAAARADEGIPQSEPRAVPHRGAPPGFVSLVGGRTLTGGSAAFAWGGWPSLGAAYAQGVTPRDDLGVLAELDWSTTEVYAGGLWRRGLGQSGAWDAAATARLSFWASLGAEHLYSDNARDAGFEVRGSVALSRPAGRGEVALRLDAPVVVALRGDNGVLFSPRLALAYEAPLYGDYTLGVLGGLGLRVGGGSAPLTDLRSDVTLLVVAGWRLF